jgi:hypothetical protein
MMFTIEFFRIRKEDNAHATLDRVTYIASDLESAKVKARSLFDTSGGSKTPVRSAEAIHLGNFPEGKMLPVEEAINSAHGKRRVRLERRRWKKLSANPAAHPPWNNDF